MGERLSGDNTFLVGLQVDEEGDLRFAIGGGILEIRFAPDDEPLAVRKCVSMKRKRPSSPRGRHTGTRNSESFLWRGRLGLRRDAMRDGELV